MSVNKNEVCARFSDVRWHDSELIELHLARVPGSNQYDLRLDLNLITGYSNDGPKMSRHSALFIGCRIIKADLDLLGLIMCGGAIASGVCYPDATELEHSHRTKIQDFDLPQDQNRLEECLGFLLEMIHPGGELLVFAQDFQLHKVRIQQNA